PKGINQIHIWSYTGLLVQLPDHPWLIKHTHKSLNQGGLMAQMIWQYRDLHREAKAQKVDIMLNTFAGTVGRFQPSITMSRDMLSYEPGEMQRFGFSFQRLRLEALKIVQNYSLTHSTASIFLTRYAAEVIQKSCGKVKEYRIINHGIGENFRQ